MSTDVASILARHRAYFLSGKTRPPEWREQQLAALSAMVTERADEFYKALWSDLRRNRVDAASSARAISIDSKRCSPAAQSFTAASPIAAISTSARLY
jgi:acyl-CoA reductase-like NAD-dependent aldehyde dehydrogenase